METFTREQITQVIEEAETAAFANPKHCAATATSEALESVRDHFKPGKCIPQKDLYHPFCFGDVYKSFHDCEPCPVFDSCEMHAMTENL